LLEINQNIKDISSISESAVENILKLRKAIATSKYSEMFQEKTYNAWIKKQIKKPLQEIISLLEKNIEVIDTSLQNFEDMLAAPVKVEYNSNIKLQEKRLKLQKKDIETFIPRLENMIEDLS